ncbi:MAG TPA: hypothetical protein VF469_02420, partial [Kofleriaceae bacterium]
VIDDGRRTMIMAPLDLARLGLDAQAGDAGGAMGHAIDDAVGSDDDDEADTDAGEPATVPEGSTLQPSEPLQPSHPPHPSQTSGRGRKKRRLRR